ncbi:hypothetical protein OPIT5_29970 [Opitutaceae bacterium TAV5]|nr:hypothetical protein OPIT5_29970 [Opitutaceae bacterium TAV5]
MFIIVALLYGAACITFLLGIVLPLITIKKEVVIFGIKWVDEMNTVSLLSGTWALLTNRQLFLFLIIFFFSMVFPALKLFFLYKIGFDSKTDLKKKKHLGWLSAVGKWSMLDIFVVGLLVVTLKLGDLVEVKVHAGLYAFAASVLLTMILTLLAKTDRFPSGPPVNR